MGPPRVCAGKASGDSKWTRFAAWYLCRVPGRGDRREGRSTEHVRRRGDKDLLLLAPIVAAPTILEKARTMYCARTDSRAFATGLFGTHPIHTPRNSSAGLRGTCRNQPSSPPPPPISGMRLEIRPPPPPHTPFTLPLNLSPTNCILTRASAPARSPPTAPATRRWMMMCLPPPPCSLLRDVSINMTLIALLSTPTSPC